MSISGPAGRITDMQLIELNGEEHTIIKAEVYGDTLEGNFDRYYRVGQNDWILEDENVSISDEIYWSEYFDLGSERSLDLRIVGNGSFSEGPEGAVFDNNSADINIVVTINVNNYYGDYIGFNIDAQILIFLIIALAIVCFTLVALMENKSSRIIVNY